MSTIVHPREPNVILFNVWNHLIQHKEEIAWAAVFGLVFAVILDILGPDSRIRTAIRHFRNRWAEHSVSLLTKRIRQLQDYQKQLTDVRWIYLFAFQNLFLILLLFGIAATCMVMAITLPFVPHPSVISRLRGITLFLPKRRDRICRRSTSTSFPRYSRESSSGNSQDRPRD